MTKAELKPFYLVYEGVLWKSIDLESAKDTHLGDECASTIRYKKYFSLLSAPLPLLSAPFSLHFANWCSKPLLR